MFILCKVCVERFIYKLCSIISVEKVLIMSLSQKNILVSKRTIQDIQTLKEKYGLESDTEVIRLALSLSAKELKI